MQFEPEQFEPNVIGESNLKVNPETAAALANIVFSTGNANYTEGFLHEGSRFQVTTLEPKGLTDKSSPNSGDRPLIHPGYRLVMPNAADECDTMQANDSFVYACQKMFDKEELAMRPNLWQTAATAAKVSLPFTLLADLAVTNLGASPETGLIVAGTALTTSSVAAAGIYRRMYGNLRRRRIINPDNDAQYRAHMIDTLRKIRNLDLDPAIYTV